MDIRKILAASIGSLATLGLLTGMVLSAPQEGIHTLPTDMDEYEHINTLVVPVSDSPIHGIHHFYMNQTGLEIFLEGGSEEYPDGTVILGKVFKPVKTAEGRYKEGDLAGYTLMKKDVGAEGTGDTGGWHFVMFGPDGKNKGVDPTGACFGCHAPSPETDFVLSKPLT